MDGKFILLVEDNYDDELLTLRALKKNNIMNEVVVARDGVQALDYLLGAGKYEGHYLSVLPAVVLLDLNLPKLDGLELLKRLRADERTKLLPVIVLTSSNEEKDIIESYNLNVHSFVPKPLNFTQFCEVLWQDFLMDDAETLIKEWTEFNTVIRNEQSCLRPVMLQAWESAQTPGFSPDNFKNVLLTEEELKERKNINDRLIGTVILYINLISFTLEGKPHVVILADSEGWILELRGKPDDFSGRAQEIKTGANWFALNIVSNLDETILDLEEPVLAYGIERCGKAFRTCACLGIPIRNKGLSLGFLCILIPCRYAHPKQIAIALTCSASIESTLAVNLTSNYEQVKRHQEMKRILATTAYELKNPLTILQGITRIFSITAISDEEKEYFDNLMNLSNNLLESLSQVLNY